PPPPMESPLLEHGEMEPVGIAETDNKKKAAYKELYEEFSGSDRPLPVKRSPAAPAATPKSRVIGKAAQSVKAAAHDDNEEIISYREFCRDRGDGFSPYWWDISTRYILKVTREDGKTVWNTPLSLIDKNGKKCFTAITPASGEIVLLPKMDLSLPYNGIKGYSVIVDGTKLQLERPQDDYLRIVLESERPLLQQIPLQICFLMDATGSMGDEIEQLQDVIFSIHSRIMALPAQPKVEFTIVAYRDRRDAFLVKGRQFTGDIDSFQLALEEVEARGGNDYPEDIEAGLGWCLDSLAWRDTSLKFIFLVADAPPHMDKKKDSYLQAARRCRKEGIMICPVGASGLDLTGEYVFRQLAMMTRGQFVFLHYGEKGESDGKATPLDPGKVSHHTGSNYNARRLDDIVVDIVSTELAFLTPEAKIVRNYPEPQQQSELLDIRMTNLLRQIVDVPTSLTGKSIVLSPVSAVDSSLNELSEYLWTSALEKLPKYTEASLIEREKLQEILREQAISISGLTEEKGAIDVGKMLNADYMILSKLHFLGSLRLCHMRMVDCTTGRIVSAARVRL
ncbi:MAG: VWA domain-containing protein, partial [Candidatus Pacearchaeota archaeon]|nr:VWA domain-containing protein [Candidatus Pacearchaeota archaeon]